MTVRELLRKVGIGVDDRVDEPIPADDPADEAMRLRAEIARMHQERAAALEARRADDARAFARSRFEQGKVLPKDLKAVEDLHRWYAESDARNGNDLAVANFESIIDSRTPSDWLREFTVSDPALKGDSKP